MDKPVKLICDAALFWGEKTLLVRYSDNNKYDLQKGWFIPDDAIQHDEHPDDAALRILKEQLGIDNVIPRLGFIESFTGNDKSWHLVFHYYIKLGDEIELKPSADIKEAEWFELNSLPERKDIAHGGWAMFTLEELKNKI